MDDDLMGRLVANRGVDCTAVEMADGSVGRFLLEREPSGRRAFARDAGSLHARQLHTRPPGLTRSVKATAPSAAVASHADAH
jgi:hypothetical protein